MFHLIQPNKKQQFDDGEPVPLTFHHKSSIDLYIAISSYPLNGFTSSSCILNALFSLEYLLATLKSAVTNMTRCFQSQWRIHSKNNIYTHNFSPSTQFFLNDIHGWLLASDAEKTGIIAFFRLNNTNIASHFGIFRWALTLTITCSDFFL